MQNYYLSDRVVIKLNGSDCSRLLNNISTNDFINMTDGTALYACLLTHHSKFVADFFAYKVDTNTFYLDVHEKFSSIILSTLEESKMTLKCDINLTDNIILFLHKNSSDAQLETILAVGQIIHFPDPRKPGIGSRIIGVGATGLTPACVEYRDLMIAENIVCGEFLNEKAFILEYNFEQMNAISFSKGCYTGQELIGRTKNTGEIRKKVYKANLLPRVDVSLAIEQYIIADEMVAHYNILSTTSERVGKIIAINSKNDTALVQIKNEVLNDNISHLLCKADGSIWKIDLAHARL